MTRDGTLAVSGTANGLLAWDRTRVRKLGEQTTVVSDLPERVQVLDTLCDDTLLAAGTESGAMRIFSLPNLKPVSEVTRYGGFVWEPLALTFEPSGMRLVFVFHTGDATEASVLPAHGGARSCRRDVQGLFGVGAGISRGPAPARCTPPGWDDRAPGRGHRRRGSATAPTDRRRRRR